jgi:hypothetical protein
MRKRIIVLTGIFILGIWIRTAFPQIVMLVDENAPKRVLVPSSTVDRSWRNSLTFNDADWTTGTGGVGYELNTGYESWIQIPVGDQMFDASGAVVRTCMIRIRFQTSAEAIAAAMRLSLRMRYDDGFVAYLNGVKIASANAPANPVYNSKATAEHEAGADPVSFDLSSSLPNLKSGENLLAVQGFNVSPNDSDFLITSSVEMDTTPPPPFMSNLPIIRIETGGRTILSDSRITADMAVIDNGKGNRNGSADAPNAYVGKIGIEIRGQSSAGYPKKSYNVETRDITGNNRNVPLLGFPEENDWILYASYIDKSLMRNALMFRLSNRMDRYASRTRFCELVLNRKYQGVYVLLEKIKRDKNRVDVAGLDVDDVQGDSLTGGYIIKIDKFGNAFFMSNFPPYPGAQQRISYQYHYPDDQTIVPQQKAYIQGFVKSFETAMNGTEFADAEKGYPAYIGENSFVDHFLLNEICKNVDGYRLSAFFYKERDSKGGKLHAGPVWDMDLALGNANYYGGDDAVNWELDNLTTLPAAKADGSQVPFWWEKLVREPAFAKRIRLRWQELRGDVLKTERIDALIDAMADTLDEAQRKNFEIWPGPGQPGEGFWPVPPVFYSFTTYQDEVNYLKYWLGERFRWIDENIAALSPDTAEGGGTQSPAAFALKMNYPNPFNAFTVIEYDLSASTDVNLTVWNVTGRKIRTVASGIESPGAKRAAWDGKDDSGRPSPTGIYLFILNIDGKKGIRKMTLLR